MTAFSNKNSFCRIHKLAPICIKTNLRENRLFAAGGRLVDKKGTHNVKIYAENQTKTILLHTRAWATAQKTPSLTTAARAVAKHTAHGQRRQYHANAEVICH